MLTRCVDKEYRDRGIHVVGLSPGTVATDMQRAIKASGINPVSRMDFSQHIPPEWPARAVAWLCTDAAREFDGGDFSLKTADGRRRVGLVPSHRWRDQPSGGDHPRGVGARTPHRHTPPRRRTVRARQYPPTRGATPPP